MQATSQRNQQGMSLLEIVISVAIAGMLMAGISSAISGAIEAQRNTRAQNEALQQTRFALNRMVTAVSKTRYLMIPLAENPATAWAESQRDVLAVTLDPTLDRDQDGWADANNDKDFLDVNNNGTRNVGEQLGRTPANPPIRTAFGPAATGGPVALRHASVHGIDSRPIFGGSPSPRTSRR